MIRTVFRLLLAAGYFYAGVLHLVRPEPFLSIMPAFIPAPGAVVFWTGVAEIAGAIALAQPFHAGLRRAGAIGLALYALCVWPANVNHLLRDLGLIAGGPVTGLGPFYHWPRMAAQPVIIWLALWTGGATDWPFRRRSGCACTAAFEPPPPVSQLFRTSAC